MKCQAVIAIIVLAAFAGLLVSAEKPQGATGQTGPRAQAWRDEASAPRAIGRDARDASGKIGKRPIWPWLVAGAVVLGVAAYFFFLKPNNSGKSRSSAAVKRDVAVQSTPPGAAVFLDGQATGLETDCVLKNVPAGRHTIRLEKDGYSDYESPFDVPADSRSPVSLEIRLSRAVLSISSPEAGLIQETGQVLPIRWSTDFQALAAASAAMSTAGLPSVRIELWKAGARAVVITESVPNSGSYDWPMPSGQTTGAGFTVRIVCPSEVSIFGESGGFVIAARVTRRYVGTTPPPGGFPLTCSFDAPIDVPDKGRIVAFRYQMKCYNETGVSITMVAPDGTKLANPVNDFLDFVETAAFNGHEMKGDWRLEVRDTVTPPERDDITLWYGWTIEITSLTWNGA
jgi:hypothetical protein